MGLFFNFLIYFFLNLGMWVTIFPHTVGIWPLFAPIWKRVKKISPSWSTQCCSLHLIYASGPAAFPIFFFSNRAIFVLLHLHWYSFKINEVVWYLIIFPYWIKLKTKPVTQAKLNLSSITGLRGPPGLPGHPEISNFTKGPTGPPGRPGTPGHDGAPGDFFSF